MAKKIVVESNRGFGWSIAPGGVGTKDQQVVFESENGFGWTAVVPPLATPIITVSPLSATFPAVITVTLALPPDATAGEPTATYGGEPVELTGAGASYTFDAEAADELVIEWPWTDASGGEQVATRTVEIAEAPAAPAAPTVDFANTTADAANTVTLTSAGSTSVAITIADVGSLSGTSGVPIPFTNPPAGGHAYSATASNGAGTSTPATGTLTTAAAGDGAHVFLIVGESNAGGYSVDDSADSYPAGVLEWKNNDSWGAIGSRLLHGSDNTEFIALPDAGANFGIDRGFARAYASLYPDAEIRFIGAARGGSGFSDNRWNKGDDRYNAAVARCNAAMAAAGPGAVLRGILWQGGGQEVSNANFQAQFHQFIADLRADLTHADSATPFILSGRFPRAGNWPAGDTGVNNVNTVLQATPNLVAYTGCVWMPNPTEGVTTDSAHLNAASMRIFGEAHGAAFERARVNASLGRTGAITLGTPVLVPIAASAGATVHNAPGVAVGTAAANRKVLVAVYYRGSTSNCIAIGATLNGVNMERLGGIESGPASFASTSFYLADAPTGTTVDVSFVTSAGVNAGNAAVVVLPVYGARHGIANGKGRYPARATATGTSLSGLVDVTAGDLLIAAATSGTVDVTATFGGGLPTTFTGTINATPLGAHFGHELVASTAAARTIDVTYTPTAVNRSHQLLVLKPE